ncbi:sodium-dependent transporter [Demequina zhanjiangensis]|uniref:Sodium-dependent transporter n=1 Tax=Demequina zhanjiangensis TaxID=3051659 RepID=A0ABT8G3N4_9MICO|nr:sodium-dependent transporter [Demequina sp. SYSU T00b26]MDN4473741.1 sodium-dependent transporter [Demequina sp. SYSU T00b26]
MAQQPTSAPAGDSASPQKREHWSGQTAFILAAIGSAVGLGNIWRFPGEAYENGGGAFMVPYLIALLTAGIPILFLENAIGHRFRGSAPLAMRRVHRNAEGVGWFHVAICFVIGLYYTAVIAWSLSYFWFSFGLDYADDPAGFFFNDYLQLGSDVTLSAQIVPSVALPLILVWALTIGILALGIHKGVERLNVVGIPLLVVTFGILAFRALSLPGASDGIEALFTPDFSVLTDPEVWIAAYGQVFFSLSLAYGVMITYASYRRRRSNVTGPALVVAFGNSSFSLLAGLAVFATLGFLAQTQGVGVDELENITGVSLSFVTFPAVIAQMPGGQFFGALFFASLVLAGLTSLISVIQTISAAFQDKFGWNPRIAAVAVGLVSAVLSVLGFSTASGLYLLDTVDQWSNQLGIVAGAVGMIAAALWFGRRGHELERHLAAVSTIRPGRYWPVLINVIALLLIYMFVSKAVSLAIDGYGGYPTWYVVVFGWGTILFIGAAGVLMPWLRWHKDIAHPTLWPSREQLGLPAEVGAKVTEQYRPGKDTP